MTARWKLANYTLATINPGSVATAKAKPKISQPKSKSHHEGTKTRRKPKASKKCAEQAERMPNQRVSTSRPNAPLPVSSRRLEHCSIFRFAFLRAFVSSW